MEENRTWEPDLDKGGFELQDLDFHHFVESLLKTVEARDRYTAGHSNRVATLAFQIAITMGMELDQAIYFHIAGHLHDIGKVGIPDGILLKSGPLSRREFAVIQEHPVIGWEILREVGSLQDMSCIVLHHHERWDGQGYPEGLQGNAIPTGARIIAVADAFDAITTTRTYRNCLSIAEALEEIERCRENQFEPAAVDGLLHLAAREPRLLEQYFHPGGERTGTQPYQSFNSLRNGKTEER